MEGLELEPAKPDESFRSEYVGIVRECFCLRVLFVVSMYWGIFPYCELPSLRSFRQVYEQKAAW